VPVRVLSGGPGRAPGRRDDAFPRVEAEAAGAQSLAALGMRFVDRGGGRGVLSWRPGSAAVGQHAVTFTATTAERLATRHTMRIEVAAAPARRYAWGLWLRVLLWLLGGAPPA